MALKTGTLGLPEVPTSWTDIAAALPTENNLVNSLYITHRNEPLRNELSVVNSPVDLRVGNKARTTISQYNSITKELGDDFQMFFMNDIDYKPGTNYNGTMVLQLQKYVNGTLVTGETFHTNLVAITALAANTLIDVCEIRPGMLLVGSCSYGSNVSYYQYINYDTTTLTITLVSSVLTNLNNPGAAATGSLQIQKVVDGKALVMVYQTNNNMCLIHRIDVTNLGNITITLNSTAYLSGLVNSSITNSSSYNPGRNFVRIRNTVVNDDHTFVIVATGSAANNPVVWTTFTFNAVSNTITVLLDNSASTAYPSNYSNINGYGPLFVLNTYSATNDLRFSIIYGVSTSVYRILTFTSATATTAAATQDITNSANFTDTSTGVQSQVTTNYIINNTPRWRINYANKTLYVVSSPAAANTNAGTHAKILTVKWNDANNTHAVTYSLLNGFTRNIESDNPLTLSVFNNVAYIAGTFKSAFFRVDAFTGASKEMVKMYNGWANLDSKRVRWSSFHNCYFVLVMDTFYYLSVDGTLLGSEYNPGYYYVASFDISTLTGEVFLAYSPVSRPYEGFNFNPSSTQYFRKYVPTLNAQNTAYSENYISNESLSNGTNLYIQDIIVFSNNSFMVLYLPNNSVVGYNIYRNGTWTPGTTTNTPFPSSYPGGSATSGANKINYYVCKTIEVSDTYLLFVMNRSASTTTGAEVNYLYRLNGARASLSDAFNIGDDGVINTGLPYPVFYNNVKIMLSDNVYGYLADNSSSISVGGLALNAYLPFYSYTDLQKISMIRSTTFAVVCEEYKTKKVFRLFDERIKALGTEITTSRQILDETYTGSDSVGGYITVNNTSDYINYLSTKRVTLRNPGAVKTTFKLSVLKSDGVTRFPIVYDYAVSPGETYISPNWNPILLASGDRLQIQSSRYWQLSVYGQQIIKANT